jgi:ribosomal protein S1
VDDPRTVVSVGQVVRVKVLDIDRERGRISLSMKATGDSGSG